MEVLVQNKIALDGFVSAADAKKCLRPKKRRKEGGKCEFEFEGVNLVTKNNDWRTGISFSRHKRDSASLEAHVTAALLT